MLEKSYVTTFDRLFKNGSQNGVPIRSIQIPLIQRDYAQGREDAAATRVRQNFLDALFDALSGGQPISLDFVYGELADGVLQPLDGQQRLTTLFLLHWLIAVRAGYPNATKLWDFTYATRTSARWFCERLIKYDPPTDVGPITEWIKDQQWFLPTWPRDPTIRAALVMIDAIDRRFKGTDFSKAWGRLTDEARPAISFHLLPLNDVGQGAELYIKMNSRGRPLTPFENFKAGFERKLKLSKSPRAEEFAHEIDGAWSNAFWTYKDSEYRIDDALLRYFHFVTELCLWQNSTPDNSNADFEERAASTFCEDTPSSRANVDFLFQAFDAWIKADLNMFDAFLTMPDRVTAANETEKVAIYSFPRYSDNGPDLMRACCRLYGDRSGDNRSFSFANILFLYAFLLRLIHTPPDFMNRLRVLRNLIEASGSEIRNERMPDLLTEVRALVACGDLAEKPSFNKDAVEDERLKAAFLEANPEMAPELRYLENHPLLRGSLVAFDLDPARFALRATAFRSAFSDLNLRPDLTGALLAHGDYSRQHGDQRRLFGTSGRQDKPWQQVLSGGAREKIGATRVVLASFLDDFARRTAAGVSARDALVGIRQDWLVANPASDGADWRWAMVKYPSMRTGESGIYAFESPPMSYKLCMLDKTQFNSNYYDPFLSAVVIVSGVGEDRCLPRQLKFKGYPDLPRKLLLMRSGTAIECIQEGFKLTAPPDPEYFSLFEQIAANNGVSPFAFNDGGTHLWTSPKVEREGAMLDKLDRVEAGAALLQALVGAGL